MFVRFFFCMPGWGGGGGHVGASEDYKRRENVFVL